MQPRISAITLGVADLARARAFYESLGWKPAGGNEHVAFFQLNGFVFALFPAAELAKDAGIPLAPVPGAISLAHNLPSREAVDALFARLPGKGARIVKTPREVFWGGYSGYFCDPDGHLWEVAWNPQWPIDENGNTHFGE